MLRVYVSVVACALALLCIASELAVADETREQRDARMGWWREAKFGMFIHWGLYAVPGGVWKGKPVDTAGEWIMFGGKIPVAEYEPLVQQFNPVKFDAKQWVQIAKNAGMKYIVITSKHHDGFCLFDSKLTDYDVMSTPFKRDIMKELSDACHEAGIKICWYHSILDWHHPDYLPRGEGSPRPWDTRPKEGANFERYLDYMNGELRELLTNYGEIGILWFDGGWEHKAEDLHSQNIVDMIRSIQPKIIINNRCQIPQDYDTPEQEIPATGIPGRDWETCMTMNDTWGFKSTDTNWKSKEDLIRKLVDIASKGGNFLLNVGPTAEGLIPDASVERLAALGDWLRVNGESIYGSSASVFKKLDWGRCTRKPGMLYLHVFDWPKDGKLEVPGLKNELRRAYLLSDKERKGLQTATSEKGVAVTVPQQAPDPIASVVALEIAGEPNVVFPAVQQAANGKIQLRAVDALIIATAAKLEGKGDEMNVGFWTNPKDTVTWEFEVRKPGALSVNVTYACEKGSEGTRYAVQVGDQQVSDEVKDTGSWSKYTTDEIGTLRLDKPGRYTLSVLPKGKPKFAVMNLRAVTLSPKAS